VWEWRGRAGASWCRDVGPGMQRVVVGGGGSPTGEWAGDLPLIVLPVQCALVHFFF
jgi:hypothetical protein